MQEIKIELTKTPKQKPQDQSKLGFGKIFTDHMYVMPYNKEQGWHDPKIVPYQPITLEPSAMVFHYGQEMFEGLKADVMPRALIFPSRVSQADNQVFDRFLPLKQRHISSSFENFEFILVYNIFLSMSSKSRIFCIVWTIYDKIGRLEAKRAIEPRRP